MTKWVVVVGVYLAAMGWLWWEAEHAPTEEEWLESRRKHWEGDE